MKKSEYLKQLKIDKLGENTIFIQNRFFNFSYTIADTVVKEEFKGQYRYFGGLQCGFDEDSEEYKRLERWLCEIAENTLECINKLK
jgi:hypothetical protein